ncbi:MAG: CYTH domain-containing protein [Pseudomonadota bacterium]|nr:CYTH domain-containing protein [Pseudomonadota bacterium]
MGIEIERKFLVSNDNWRSSITSHQEMVQGYLNLEGNSVVRVRIASNRAWINIKGATIDIRRREYEYPIPIDDAREIMDHLCAGPAIEKRRYYVPIRGHVYEVDEFLGANEGLVVAEIELSDEREAFERPEWLGAEVSHDPRYLNVSLVRHPYSEWTASERNR